MSGLRRNDHAKFAPGNENPHSFHIPVMGTGFTIDTPLRVAKYGISSVVSIGDDVLIESMRKYHCEQNRLAYEEIPARSEDSRSRRISAYLDLMQELVKDQSKRLQAEPFEEGSDISKYFNMLPETPLKLEYRAMLATDDESEKSRRQDALRARAIPGSIDVNIMAKADFDRYRNGEKLPPEEAVAMSAVRGFANSGLESSIVLSAGLNRRLYAYITEFQDFYPDENGRVKKKIILKVSDFRSALLQGKLLAKKGLWISEFRVESGLNCGGHAFSTKGYLMGPILEEFKQKRTELVEEFHTLYSKALTEQGHAVGDRPRGMKVTVQGGIATAEEDEFLRTYYQLDGTGWGTPFLLVPEATRVDPAHLKKLCEAGDNDVFLSGASPLGVPFWTLRNSSSEEARRKRIAIDKPGSPCPKGFLSSDTEFTSAPICKASRTYQKRKLNQLAASTLATDKIVALHNQIVAKACICHDLAGGATLLTGIDPKARPAICCGPVISAFSKTSTLEEMVGHIYGRLSIMTRTDRSHMLVNELQLYVDFLKQEIIDASAGLLSRTQKHFAEFKENLVSGAQYYRQLAEEFGKEKRESFLKDIEDLLAELDSVSIDSFVAMSARAM